MQTKNGHKEAAAKRPGKSVETAKLKAPEKKQALKEHRETTLKPQITAPEPNKTTTEPRLNRRQQLFVQEYLVDLNAKRAATAVGYSEKTADSIGRENLRKPQIKAAIDTEIAKRKARISFTADQVMEELARIGFSDMKDFIEIDGGGAIRAFPLDGLAEGKSRIIKKVKEKRVIRTTKGTESNPDGDQILDSTYEFELCDKVKSLELLARHLGLLHDKTEVDLKQPLTIVTKDFYVGADGTVKKKRGK
jgi:phage terminase small subunit